MTTEEINALGHGDIILIDRGECSYLRTVIEGPRDNPQLNNKYGVTVPIMKRSWTNRIHTILDRDFLRKNATYTGMKAKKLMGGDELSRLIDKGWNVAKEIVRELKEAKETKARMMRWHTQMPIENCKKITDRALSAVASLKKPLAPTQRRTTQ